MNDCYIALGGNEGDVVATMDAALDALDRINGLNVTGVSRVFETAPVGADAGDVFLNAAAVIDTSLTAREILEHLKDVEQSLGRRESQRWTSRIIDLDLLLCGTAIVDEPGLSVPHPHLWWRRFVLDPLTDIAADVVHPVLGETLDVLRNRLMHRPLSVAVSGGCPEERLAVGSLLTQRGFVVEKPSAGCETGLRLGFVDTGHHEPHGRWIELASIPGGLVEATQSIMTAALDRPRVHSLPLRRVP